MTEYEAFEKKALDVVRMITDTPAAFTNGTLFVTTSDSKLSVRILTALEAVMNCGICFGPVGQETYYDFV